ncbi:CHASE domain-containing protein [Accumulibacter sp.]|uniref:CHASE domain-containing protein n=1 Tax=Accumulibacter sp. TaxID=2053492 RepID=UPI0033905D8E
MAIRADGFPEYALRPPGERRHYSSIVYLEPFDWRNQRAFGYDMYSEPVRQRAMERAWKKCCGSLRPGHPASGNRQGRSARILMYLPSPLIRDYADRRRATSGRTHRLGVFAATDEGHDVQSA